MVIQSGGHPLTTKYHEHKTNTSHNGGSFTQNSPEDEPSSLYIDKYLSHTSVGLVHFIQCGKMIVDLLVCPLSKLDQ